MKPLQTVSLPSALAKHLRDVYTGGNWTCVNLKETLADVTLDEALAQRPGFHTIAALAYHIHYYVATLLKVLQGGPLDAHDKYSFDHPAFSSGVDWQVFLERIGTDAEAAAALVEALPEFQIWEPFVDAKYGTYYRNIQGTIEHAHYHLGQIALLKKGLRQPRS